MSNISTAPLRPFPCSGSASQIYHPETTYSASLTSTYRSEKIAAEVSGYANYIDDYIYFSPALNERWRADLRRAYPRQLPTICHSARRRALCRCRRRFRCISRFRELNLGGQASMVRAKNLTDDSLLGAGTDRPSARFSTLSPYASDYVARKILSRGSAELSLPGSGVLMRMPTLAEPPDGYFLIGR